MGNGYSIAWRVLDAQFWGVPQRRRRIALVADFGGSSAPEILFERESLPGNSASCGTSRKGAADNLTDCFGITNRGRITGEVSETLRAGSHGALPMICSLDNGQMGESGVIATQSKAFGICSYASNSMLSDNPHSGIYEAETARTLDGNCGNPTCNQGGIAVIESYAIQGSMIGRDDKNGPRGDGINEDVSFTLNTVDRHAVYAMTTGSFTQVDEDTSPTIMARDYKDPNAICMGHRYTVRRLTPAECARLQGFPDNWCADLGTEKSTDEEMYFWHKVFKTYSEVTGC